MIVEKMLLIINKKIDEKPFVLKINCGIHN